MISHQYYDYVNHKIVITHWNPLTYTCRIECVRRSAAHLTEEKGENRATLVNIHKHHQVRERSALKLSTHTVSGTLTSSTHVGWTHQRRMTRFRKPFGSVHRRLVSRVVRTCLPLFEYSSFFTTPYLFMSSSAWTVSPIFFTICNDGYITVGNTVTHKQI